MMKLKSYLFLFLLVSSLRPTSKTRSPTRKFVFNYYNLEVFWLFDNLYFIFFLCALMKKSLFHICLLIECCYWWKYSFNYYYTLRQLHNQYWSADRKTCVFDISSSMVVLLIILWVLKQNKVFFSFVQVSYLYLSNIIKFFELLLFNSSLRTSAFEALWLSLYLIIKEKTKKNFNFLYWKSRGFWFWRTNKINYL